MERFYAACLNTCATSSWLTQVMQFRAASLATLPAAWLTRQRGRKASIVVAALCYLLGVGLNAGAVNLAMLVVGRLWQGAGVGFSLQASTCSHAACLQTGLLRLRLHFAPST